MRARRRRWWIRLGGVVGILVALALWAFWLEPASFRVRETTLRLGAWPSEMDSLRVAVVADLHTGSPWNGLSQLERIVRETNAAQPDLILIRGDLVIGGIPGGQAVSPEAIADELAALEAPLGVYGVLGNHDWWLDGPRVARAMESAGIVVLKDTSTAVPVRGDTLWLAGVSDAWEAPHDIDRALAEVPEDATVLAFTHNPDLFPDIPPRVALTVAGHTHGGQVHLPLLGPPRVPSRYGDRYAAGHVREGGRDLFVSTGVGTSILPIRFRVPPEVSLLTLRATPD
ncbi:MAG: metallophosphoesterase [Bacteroidota bacterium]